MSIEGAPAGWSVSVTNEVQSGTSTQVSVNVPSDALEDSFSFDVVATTGDVERRATLTVVTLFGLIPECTATIQGTVTDELGNPIVGAEFDPTIRAPTAFTGADGTFSIDRDPVHRGATIERFVWDVIGPSGDTLYIQYRGGPHYARCGETTDINPVMEVVPDATGLTIAPSSASRTRSSRPGRSPPTSRSRRDAHDQVHTRKIPDREGHGEQRRWLSPLCRRPHVQHAGEPAHVLHLGFQARLLVGLQVGPVERARRRSTRRRRRLPDDPEVRRPSQYCAGGRPVRRPGRRRGDLRSASRVSARSRRRLQTAR